MHIPNVPTTQARNHLHAQAQVLDLAATDCPKTKSRNVINDETSNRASGNIPGRYPTSTQPTLWEYSHTVATPRSHTKTWALAGGVPQLTNPRTNHTGFTSALAAFDGQVKGDKAAR